LISRDDFVFTIGYDGSTAVVDGAMKRRYHSLSTAQLAEEGLYKQALCSALYEQAATAGKSGNGAAAGQRGSLEKVLEVYNRQAERKLASVEELERTFGAFEVPEGISRVLVL
jgi:hypothetical protein